MRGKFVDAYFDLGEHAAAKAFMKELENFGLRSELYDDHCPTWYGNKPRPWFIKYTIGILGFLFLWFASERVWPGSAFSKVMAGIFLLFALAIPYVYGVRRREPKTDGAQRWGRNLEWRFTLGLLFTLVLVPAIIAEPWLGIVALAIGVGGVGCASIIRAVNPRS